ncbi:hypothetical protein CDD82_2530 [Ophiocordyceps australis]|uniref:F-box domain-containing protein n=1 Tax=Ophiocordyceps australis TaxID=1399860 RepID=A0A2C5ZHM4_9HYPO|nr:hypothetical protein CDD82_2530 [Ophiocordyceps australis]
MARKRIFPMSEWAPAQEAMLGGDLPPLTAGPEQQRSSELASTTAPAPEKRHRSLSLSLPWRRPKASSFAHLESHNVPQDAVDDEPDAHEPVNDHDRAHGASSTFKGFLRRASMSFKGMVHRRESCSAADILADHQPQPSRPTTSHGTWNRLRQAASFRRSPSIHDASDLSSQHFASNTPNPSHLPIPAMGHEPPIIPSSSGAAAKASVAMQNDVLHHGLNTRWLHTTPSNEENNDRESGIGIAVSLPFIEVDEVDDEGALVPKQDTNISRLDFITLLPAELSIQVLSYLDAAALFKARSVSRGWKSVTTNQHIWRESCLRETTTTYATGKPIEPGTGMGVPRILPSNDWRKIYQAKLNLTQRWKGGQARPFYLNGHMDSIYCLQFDEHKIVSGSRDRTIRVWDMHTLECRLVIGPPEVLKNPNLLQDPEGKSTHYATGLERGRTVHSTPRIVSFAEHHKASILCLQYDDEILVTGSSDATCIVYDINNGYQPIRRLRHHTAAVLDLAFDKKHIVTCSKDISICVWDRETGHLLRQLRGHSGPVNAVQMRGNTIVSCSGDFRVKLWNIDTGKNIREFVGHTKGLACSQFSEDGRYVASAGNDKVIRIWDANTGECLREMKAHNNLVRSLYIDSVSGRLVSGSYDTDIKVWDMETGNQLLDFPRWHASWVLSAKSDYRRIVSTGQDPKILIMDFGAGVDGIELLESNKVSGLGPKPAAL